jgi:threonine dehydrogenase-like Zn-dependent dehydrogenase
MMKLTPDGHRMGRIVGVGGVTAQVGLAAALGNIDLISAARTGPGYHDEAWERGADYPPVFVEFDTQRNLEESLRAMAEGRLRVEAMITHRVPLDRAPEVCEELIQRPDAALGVVLLME